MDDIVISKADVLRFLDEIEACEETREQVSRLSNSLPAESVWRLMNGSQKAWFLNATGADSKACGCNWCGAEDEVIARRWPYARVLKFLIGDLP
jgi:hypothetical protein